jgi:hypothetical protein
LSLNKNGKATRLSKTSRKMEPTMIIAFFMEIEVVVNEGLSNCEFGYGQMNDPCQTLTYYL